MSVVTAAIVLGVLLAISGPAQGLTIVVDFNDDGQANTSDIFGNAVQTFDVTAYGFAESDYATVTAAIMAELERDYHGIPTTGANALSPIPDGFELDFSFVVGNVGSPPLNGDPEYYFIQVGVGVPGSGPNVDYLGFTSINSVRSSNGGGLPASVNGRVFGSVFTNSINVITFPDPYSDALVSGNISATAHAIEGTLAHEIGHALSLRHITKADATTLLGMPPVMGIGSLDLDNIDRIFDRDFDIGHIGQLEASVGIRPVPEPGTMFVLLGGGISLLVPCRRRR